MDHSLTLKSVAKQFTSWREIPHQGRRTPDELKQQAIALKSHYPVGQIINTLGINHRTLKRWSVQSEALQSTPFISLPTSLPKKSEDPPLLASCEFPNGIQLKLTHESLNTDLLSRLYQLTPKSNA